MSKALCQLNGYLCACATLLKNYSATLRHGKPVIGATVNKARFKAVWYSFTALIASLPAMMCSPIALCCCRPPIPLGRPYTCRQGYEGNQGCYLKA